MNTHGTGAPETVAGASAREYWSWFAFWAQFAVLGFCVALGGVYAGDSADPDDGAAGLLLIVAAIALAFMRIKHHFDGRPPRWGDYLLVDTLPDLALAILMFVILALIGLIAASESEFGALHNGGVALFGASALGVFLNLKRYFDALETRR